MTTITSEQNGIQHQSVLHVDHRVNGQNVVFSTETVGEEVGLTPQTYRMTEAQWEDLGRPTHISISVRAGDLLNPETHAWVPPWTPDGVPPSIWCQTCHEHKALHAEYRRHPDQRVFGGKPDGEMELWLGDAFETWLPSTEKLIIRNYRGEEQTVRAGQWLIKGPDGRFRIEDQPDHE